MYCILHEKEYIELKMICASDLSQDHATKRVLTFGKETTVCVSHVVLTKHHKPFKNGYL